MQQCYASRRRCMTHSTIEAPMKRIGLLLLLSGVLSVVARPSAMIPDQVRIETGALAGVVGATQPTVRAFKGIPFAAPPLGENRWRAPQPAAKWDGVRNADAFGAPCAAGAPVAAAVAVGSWRRSRAGAGRGRASARAGTQRGLPVSPTSGPAPHQRTTGGRSWCGSTAAVSPAGPAAWPGMTARTSPPRVR